MFKNKKKYTTPKITAKKIKISFFQNIWWTHHFNIAGDVYAQSTYSDSGYSDSGYSNSYSDSGYSDSGYSDSSYAVSYSDNSYSDNSYSDSGYSETVVDWGYGESYGDSTQL